MDTHTITQSSASASVARMQHLMSFLSALGYNTTDITVDNVFSILGQLGDTLKDMNIVITKEIENPWK